MTLPLQQIKLLLLRFSFPVPVHRAGGFLRILPLFHLEVVGNEIDQLGDDHQVAPEHQAFDSNLRRVIPVSGASLKCWSMEVLFQFSPQMLCCSQMRCLLNLEEVGQYWNIQEAESKSAIQ